MTTPATAPVRTETTVRTFDAHGNLLTTTTTTVTVETPPQDAADTGTGLYL